jgi:RNA polymerase sigma-70 factor (ECF subfamily)
MAPLPNQLQFERLLDDHRKILYKICHSYCRNAADREDLAQEIAVQLWRSFASFDGRCAFSTWMYRVALNVAISFCRSEATRTRRAVGDGEAILQTLGAAEPESGQVQTLYQMIETLDPMNKALVLLYLDGYSQKEIGEVLGIGPGNVGTKIGRIKETLKRSLEAAKKN